VKQWPFEPRQKVWYTPQVKGGYGWPGDIPAVVVRYSTFRIVVRVYFQDPQYGSREIAVHPRNLRPRED
jgi:hypothetical protein